MSIEGEISAYKYRAGDVLQKHMCEGWMEFSVVTPSKRASCVQAVGSGNYCGVPGQFRIVRRDGAVVLS